MIKSFQSQFALRSFRLTCFVICLCTNYALSQDVRIATFNTSLYRAKSGQLLEELSSGKSKQAMKVAQILQIIRPQIVLLNEFDFDRKGAAIREFQSRYLGQSQQKNRPIKYNHVFVPPVNTGLPSGLDLDQDGKSNGPGDSFGFGRHPGQYGLVVLSQFPIDRQATRTFQKFLWRDMPGALLPEKPDGTGYYNQQVLEKFRLSSKNHCDVVIKTGKQDLHFLVSHPTPPVFDGQEDRNGRRNHDEIRFWNDYIRPQKSAYIYDDKKNKGGLPLGSGFVIAGDLNADPNDGDSTNNPIGLFRNNGLINFKLEPKSEGAAEASKVGAANRQHRGDPSLDTADFNDQKVGNLRIDYVLPSVNLKAKAAGVFWPSSKSSQAKLTKVSDHRLVWIDLEFTQGE